jgi:hypothetical protein
MLGCGERRTEHRHVQQPGMTICHDGIDSGKNSFHLVGLDRRGAIGCGRSGYGQLEARLAACRRLLAGRLVSAPIT